VEAALGSQQSNGCIDCHLLAAWRCPSPCLQVTVSKSPPSAAAVVKSDNAAAAEHVIELLQNLLLTL
jgi:hypothetical protein